jgi:hypothetical protein
MAKIAQLAMVNQASLQRFFRRRRSAPTVEVVRMVLPVVVVLVVLASVVLVAVAIGRLVARDGLGDRPGPRSRHDVWCQGADGPEASCGC